MERQTTTLLLRCGISSIEKDHISFFEDADRIEFKHCSFKYRVVNDEMFYHPVDGKYGVLGVTVPIREYSFEELKKEIGENPVLLVYDKYKPGDNLFDVEKHDSRIDFSATISALEARGIIKTRKSASQLATDNRVFSFGDINEDEGEEWWEVDILGTPFGRNQTERAIKLYTT